LKKDPCLPLDADSRRVVPPSVFFSPPPLLHTNEKVRFSPSLASSPRGGVVSISRNLVTFFLPFLWLILCLFRPIAPTALRSLARLWGDPAFAVASGIFSTYSFPARTSELCIFCPSQEDAAGSTSAIHATELFYLRSCSKGPAIVTPPQQYPNDKIRSFLRSLHLQVPTSRSDIPELARRT